jgi:hypothetical protein
MFCRCLAQKTVIFATNIAIGGKDDCTFNDRNRMRAVGVGTLSYYFELIF